MFLLLLLSSSLAASPVGGGASRVDTHAHTHGNNQSNQSNQSINQSIKEKDLLKKNFEKKKIVRTIGKKTEGVRKIESQKKKLGEKIRALFFFLSFIRGLAPRVKDDAHISHFQDSHFRARISNLWCLEHVHGSRIGFTVIVVSSSSNQRRVAV